ncbi:MAG TPA: MotA/TolQ/ExbB proton channel family protein [Tenuifilaceae bacterium]|nr:MotA/TolQ/ExbB proton channel family protein [Tenuifilaceae bacterium]HPE17256.1 MotA/TolQ/ExbB proton channel family protein [Tenuifilaceae bacterium]HPJ44483.1 MotA/TolQ/ExbB proton channel family protein [Tenuifilaceae bacterium]HPQ33021.1 MotA/TolQ/ExbB proton channel family protein [Tenuifilaceae bacterium]HRX67952.1 MotA/TolQ/ExbB proton channel family protein [Tenuifilaceae bacterium]
MVPLALLWLIAVYLFIERYWAIKKASRADVNFMNRIKEYIHDDKIESAMALCQAQNTPVARMIEKGIQRIGRPLSDVNAAVENVGNLEISKLEGGLPTLATIAGGAPMIGFLGTVIGMIRAFYDMSMAGNNIDVGLLSNGIYTAMVTTVAGLIVGIAAYFGYNYLVARVEKVVFTMEANTTEFMDLLNEPVS